MLPLEEFDGGWGREVLGSAEASAPSLCAFSHLHPPSSATPPTLGWVGHAGDETGVLYVLLFILFCKCLPTFPCVFNVPLPSA